MTPIWSAKLHWLCSSQMDVIDFDSEFQCMMPQHVYYDGRYDQLDANNSQRPPQDFHRQTCC
jgi:hypothetical protein